MPQYNDVDVITLDGQPFAVSAMSPEIQELMELYNDWSRRAFDVQQELQMINMAREGVSQQIGKRYHEERAAAAAQAEAQEEVVPGTAPDPTPTEAAAEPEGAPAESDES